MFFTKNSAGTTG
ncbi:hypothetical protein FCS21_07910 [Colwellia ponticola]|uniref:Uncharacterized protein n=1 Tax=Colwellia ponticola TaxID=2304625 RepID=A0A8H2PM45_9GAMM|nr:hypothetical protein FCS21_07910 [Colwellia ponticola]